MSADGSHECRCGRHCTGKGIDGENERLRYLLAKERDEFGEKETKLMAEISRLKAALEKIINGRFHIGNDVNGNVFGPPDAVMCRNISKQALSPQEGGGK